MSSNWQMMKLIDVIQKTETINPKKNPDSTFEYIDVSSICNKQFVIQETSTVLGKDAPSRARKLVRTDDILFATIRPTLKRIAQVPNNLDKQVCSTGYFVLRPKDFVEGRFLFYFLFTENFMGEMEKLQKGASYPAVNDGEVSSQTIYLPSFDEQKRIVAILDEAFEGCDRAIRNTENNLANARELFESYRNSILTQNNKEWQETTLGNEIDLMTGFPFKSNQYTDSEQSIRLLRGDNIIQGVLRWDDVKKWSKSNINGFLVYQLKEGDVVLAMDRPWVKAGLKHAMISIDDLPCLLVQRTACLRAKNMSNRFLMYSIGSHSFIQHILSNQTGIGVPHISGKQIQSFKLLKPPLSEQLQISDNLDKLYTETQCLETIYRQKLAALKELKQSILQKAFTGELTADKEVA